MNKTTSYKIFVCILCICLISRAFNVLYRTLVYYNICIIYTGSNGENVSISSALTLSVATSYFASFLLHASRHCLYIKVKSDVTGQHKPERLLDVNNLKQNMKVRTAHLRLCEVHNRFLLLCVWLLLVRLRGSAVITSRSSIHISW